MKKWSAIVTGTLLVFFLPITLVTLSQPAQISQQKVLLSYQHQGSFNYLVSLKPSSLYGTTSATLYPLAIAQSMDLSYTYTAVAPFSGSYRVDATLENPGLWNKSIALMGATPFDGNFQSQFSIDLPGIIKTFDDIESELGLSSTTRSLSINVSVSNNDEQFTQSLPVTLSDNVLEVSNSLVERHLSGSGVFNYSIELLPNSIFSTSTLSPPAGLASPVVLGPGEMIPFRLADNMLISLAYDFTANQALQNLKSDVSVVATLEAANSWSKQFPLFNSSENGKFDVDFQLDLNGIRNLLTALSTDAGVSADSYKLTLKATVHTTASSAFGPINDTYEALLPGTISGNVIQWSDQLSSTKSGTITQPSVLPNPKLIAGMSIPTAQGVSGVLTGMLLILFIVSLAFYLTSPKAQIPALERESMSIKRKHGERLVESRAAITESGETVVSLENMASLMNVADELGKPVVHQAPWKDGAAHEYYVLDGAVRYQYLLG